MRRQPVESSAVVSIGYDPDLQILEIEYTGGRVYRYPGVPLEEYEALMNADSIGTYVNQVIKTKYSDYYEV
jgi:hypothetical protein